MGLNTIHDSSYDYMISHNLTKKCDIKGNVLDAVEYARVERIAGMPSTKFSFVIRCNGWANVSEGDKIKTPLSDKILVVQRILDKKDNNLQFKHRRDVENFTGSCDIFLE